MRDRQVESLYYPQEFLPPESLGRVLCVAPHPDDEVFGAGGLLALLGDRGLHPQSLILSRGERAAGDPSGAMAAERERESRRAADVLGLDSPRCADWPDRDMRFAEPLIERIASVIEECGTEVLLLPALSEPHPDHQAVALAGMAAAQRGDVVRTLLFYEVGAPMHPNVLVDITGVEERKWQAMRQFASQEVIQPYETQARALATLRAFGHGAACRAAEAFFRVDVSALREQGAGAALPWWPMVRARQRLANAPEQLPLVSVLIRSVDRPELSEAIASVATQTYPNLEVVVLNASGRAHGPVVYPQGRMTLRVVDADDAHRAGGGACGRARAANQALQAARGEFALFLDDDDLLYPGHLERLVSALGQRPDAVAAYGGVRVEGPDGGFMRDYDLPWSRPRLRAINFLPIHAVLFRLDRVRQEGLRFDETLPVLEDWQFWLQLAALGDFVHCPGISALYRQRHGQSGVGDPAHRNHWERWHRVLIERSVACAPDADVAGLLAWHAVELDRAQSRQEALAAQLAAEQADARELAGRLLDLQAQHGDLQGRHGDLQARHGDLEREFERAQTASHDLSARLLDLRARHGELERAKDLRDREVRMMRESRSWKLTRPLRALTSLLTRGGR